MLPQDFLYSIYGMLALAIGLVIGSYMHQTRRPKRKRRRR